MLIDAGFNVGYARGNNLGLRYIQNYNLSDYVCICNPDIEIDQENLLKLISIIKSGKAPEFFGVQIKDYENNLMRNNWTRPTLLEDILDDFYLLRRILQNLKRKVNKNSEDQNIKSTQSVDIITGAFFVAKLDTFSKVNFFDDRTFLFCEERILATRLDRAKIPRYVLNDVSCRHNASTTIKKEYNSRLKRHILLVRSRLIYYRHYSGIFNTIIYAITIPFSLSEKIVIDKLLWIRKNQ